MFGSHLARPLLFGHALNLGRAFLPYTKTNLPVKLWWLSSSDGCEQNLSWISSKVIRHKFAWLVMLQLVNLLVGYWMQHKSEAPGAPSQEHTNFKLTAHFHTSDCRLPKNKDNKASYHSVKRTIQPISNTHDLTNEWNKATTPKEK
jgi:hypothetical protein